jgi:hypothetical protein
MSSLTNKDRLIDASDDIIEHEDGWLLFLW